MLLRTESLAPPTPSPSPSPSPLRAASAAASAAALDGHRPLRVGLFTDTLDEINGVGRFIRDMGEQAQLKGRHFVIHTCARKPRHRLPNRRNFEPMLSSTLPYYPELEMNLPPLPEILDWAERQRFDVVHISTPGAMGLCGLAVARALRVPALATYHTDFPAYVENLVGDHRVTAGTTFYMKWIYRRMATVFSRSREYQASLRQLGIAAPRLATTLPGVNTEKFNPKHRDDAGLWPRLGVRQARRLLYCGRISIEKNLPLLADAFARLCAMRHDTALVLAGDGPYMARMQAQLRGLPAYFLGYQNDQQLGPLYASADLFVFPSLTDTLGQVVMESQASGLPVLVSDVGGPQEMIEDGVTGQVLRGGASSSADAWCAAIDALLNDAPRRQRMARAAVARIAPFSLEKTFDAFWQAHADAHTRNGAAANGSPTS